MPDMTRQQMNGGGGFAKIVAQAGITHGQWRPESGGHVQNQQQVLAGIHFRVVIAGLHNAKQRVHFRQHMRKRIAFA